LSGRRRSCSRIGSSSGFLTKRPAGGTASAAGTTGTAGTGVIPLRNPPVGSAGCGKPTTVTNGKKTITSGGQQRTYIIDIPANYDMNKPYRFFYTSQRARHLSGAAGAARKSRRSLGHAEVD
jgi:hypothetical protein